MGRAESFSQVILGLRRGDDDAADAVHRRFVRRLVLLAATQFNRRHRRLADPESAVQSAFGAFFQGVDAGRYELESWDAVWGLLATITVHKCGRRRERLGARCRDVLRTVGGLGAGDAHPDPLDRAPRPDEAAVLNEAVEAWLKGLPPLDREVVELGLQDRPDEEIAHQLGRSARTVRRVRERVEGDLRDRLARERLGA
jgi:DNA-directed RNA polymerase specialized sigma24 family protein